MNTSCGPKTTLRMIYILVFLLKTALINANFVTEDGIPVKVDISMEEEIQFRNEYDLAQDVNLTILEIPFNNNIFEYGNRIYGNNADPIDIFTDGATYTHNGVAIDLPVYNIFQEEDADGKRVTISKDAHGKTQAVMIVGKDGSSEELVSIVPGILVSIKPSDYDVEGMLSKFGHADIGGDKTFGHAILPLNKTDPQGCPEYKQIELAVVYDVSFCNENGGDQQTADNMAIYLVALVSSRYQQDNLCVKVEIKHLEGYCDASRDPYREMIASGKSGCRSTIDTIGILPDFGEYWNANRMSVRRDTVALLTGSPMDCGQTCIVGCAKMDSTCVREKAYSVTWATFTKSPLIISTALAHELGHNNGSPHYTEEKKYIMNTIISQGANGFSLFSISQMNRHFSLVSCIDTISSNAPTSSPTGTIEDSALLNCPRPFLNFLKFTPVLLMLVCLYPLRRYWRHEHTEQTSEPPTDDESQPRHIEEKVC